MRTEAGGSGARIPTSTAVGAPAPTDKCNWLPMSALRREDPAGELCGRPSVQNFIAVVGGKRVRIERCDDHKLADEFIGKFQQGWRT